jgi:hypothetical protein
MTLEEVRAEHPALVAQIQDEARSEALAEARERGKVEARTEAATAERERILGIVGHGAAEGKRAIALKLAAMPAMTVALAATLMADMPRVAEGPEAEFHAQLEKTKGTLLDDGLDEVSAFLKRMQGYDAAMRAEEYGCRAMASDE